MATTTNELEQAADAKAQKMVEEWREILTRLNNPENLLADLLALAFMSGANWRIENWKG